MCYPKPGPRCSNHTRKELKRALKNYQRNPIAQLATVVDEARANYESSPEGIRQLHEAVRANPQDELLYMRLSRAESKRQAAFEALEREKIAQDDAKGIVVISSASDSSIEQNIISQEHEDEYRKDDTSDDKTEVSEYSNVWGSYSGMTTGKSAELASISIDMVDVKSPIDNAIVSIKRTFGMSRTNPVTQAREWSDSQGRLHRDGDEPAVIEKDGTKKYYKHGKLHRDGDKPAIYLDETVYLNDFTEINYKEMYFKEGMLHRDGDKPAVVLFEGNEDSANDYIDSKVSGQVAYYQHGKLHRENEAKPAKIQGEHSNQGPAREYYGALDNHREHIIENYYQSELSPPLHKHSHDRLAQLHKNYPFLR